ncbi:MAG TPA: glycosyltransferase WbuB [Alphaproteobacteria bacterium]|nr:glycosyltransferase WbuB [Alphaproteobacteria bacterium]
MRILVYSINYAPELTGIGKFTAEMCDWFAANGHEVRVVTTPPYYPDWKVRDGYSAWMWRSEVIKGVPVTRCPLWVPAKPSGLKRAVHLLSFALSSFPAMIWQALRFRPEVICTIKPPMFAEPVGWLAARLCGALAWTHVQDLEVDAAFDMGMLPSGGLKSATLAVDNWLLRRFDFATTISLRMQERLWRKGMPQDKTGLYPNWVEAAAIQPQTGSNPYRAELGIDAGQIVALYSGNMGEKQGLDTLIDTARAVADDPKITVVLCGEGAARQRLQDNARGLANVRFLPLQPLERLGDLLNLADVHLLPQRADAADLVMPSKLGGMLATGRPVVAGAHPGTQVAMAVADCGIVVPPDDGLAMAGALKTLAADSTRRSQLGVVARQRALSDWDRDGILGRLQFTLKDKIYP